MNKFTTAVQIAAARSLPLRARLRLLALRLARRRFRQTVFEIPLGPGTCHLDMREGKTDYLTFREIFVRECYRTDYRGRSVLDLGAHRGYFGAYALLKGAAKVVSFEPEQVNFSFLERTASSFVAGGSMWEIERAAVSPADGDATLYVRDESWSHSVLKQAGDAENAVGVQTVPMWSLERALERLGSREPVIVKMDIEGSEEQVVLDSSDDVWSAVGELFVEIEPFCSVDASSLLDRLALVGLRSAGPPVGNVYHLVR
jgi:FkbM family methyltransferase